MKLFSRFLLGTLLVVFSLSRASGQFRWIVDGDTLTVNEVITTIEEKYGDDSDIRLWINRKDIPSREEIKAEEELLVTIATERKRFRDGILKDIAVAERQKRKEEARVKKAKKKAKRKKEENERKEAKKEKRRKRGRQAGWWILALLIVGGSVFLIYFLPKS